MEKIIDEISDKFLSNGYEIFLGGPESFLLYLKKNNVKSLSFMSNCDLVFIAKNFEKVEYGKDGFSATIYLNGTRINFQLFPDYNLKNKNTLEKLLGKHSLNIEAFFYNPEKGKFYDPFSSFYSLKNKKILFLKVDGINNTDILRGILYASEYNMDFEFSGKTNNSIISEVDIKYFFKVLTSKNPHTGVKLLEKFGFLKKIIPEIESLKGCPQDKDFHPEGDVFVHTIECFKHLKSDNIVLSIALLLHDIGKPITIKYSPNLSFPGHAFVGAKVARKICKRLGFSKNQLDELTFYIKNHLLGSIFKNSSREYLRHILNSPYYENLLKLYKADILGSFGNLRDYKQIVKISTSIKNS